jgi:hypothetical protein
VGAVWRLFDRFLVLAKPDLDERDQSIQHFPRLRRSHRGSTDVPGARPGSTPLMLVASTSRRLGHIARHASRKRPAVERPEPLPSVKSQLVAKGQSSFTSLPGAPSPPVGRRADEVGVADAPTWQTGHSASRQIVSRSAPQNLADCRHALRRAARRAGALVLADRRSRTREPFRRCTALPRSIRTRTPSPGPTRWRVAL